jgi:hypothetical protein
MLWARVIVTGLTLTTPIQTDGQTFMMSIWDTILMKNGRKQTQPRLTNKN